MRQWPWQSPWARPLHESDRIIFPRVPTIRLYRSDRWQRRKNGHVLELESSREERIFKNDFKPPPVGSYFTEELPPENEILKQTTPDSSVSMKSKSLTSKKEAKNPQTQVSREIKMFRKSRKISNKNHKAQKHGEEPESNSVNQNKQNTPNSASFTSVFQYILSYPKMLS